MSRKNPYKRGGMFEGALNTVFENAKKNRSHPTAAETVLWMHLKAGMSGCRFRMQHPIGMYIADFYCHKANLIVEVYGSIHQVEDVKKNEEKEAYLAGRGYSILRFTNNEVMNEREGVLSKILAVVNNNTRNQSPDNGGESPL